MDLRRSYSQRVAYLIQDFLPSNASRDFSIYSVLLHALHVPHWNVAIFAEHSPDDDVARVYLMMWRADEYDSDLKWDEFCVWQTMCTDRVRTWSLFRMLCHCVIGKEGGVSLTCHDPQGVGRYVHIGDKYSFTLIFVRVIWAFAWV